MLKRLNIDSVNGSLGQILEKDRADDPAFLLTYS